MLDTNDQTPGEVVADRYQLGERIGRGGMGEVRVARDLTLGREVAIKLMHEGLAADERVSRRFQHEAWAAARLTHPNVVRVYDAGVHRGRPYIVMERLHGGTLADEIARGPLDERRVRTVGAQVLDALAAAHDNGVLHRDVKPSNVMRGPDGTVRVCDFGIAKTDLLTDRTTTGTVVGTLGYLAPERMHGRPATAASDLYSVGVMLYEALTGRRPFAGDSPVAVLAAIQQGDPEPLERLRPDVDPTLCAIVRRAMRADPERRFRSAREFAAALRDEPPVRRTRPAASSAVDGDRTAVMSAPLRAPVPPPPPPTPSPGTPPRGTTLRTPARGTPAVDGTPRPSGGRALRLVGLFAALIVLGAAIGAGVGLLLRDDGDGGRSSAGQVGDPLERALVELEEAITP